MNDYVYRVWNKKEGCYASSNRRMIWETKGTAKAFISYIGLKYGYERDPITNRQDFVRQDRRDEYEVHEFALTRQPQPLSEIL